MKSAADYITTYRYLSIAGRILIVQLTFVSNSGHCQVLVSVEDNSASNLNFFRRWFPTLVRLEEGRTPHLLVLIPCSNSMCSGIPSLGGNGQLVLRSVVQEWPSCCDGSTSRSGDGDSIPIEWCIGAM